MEYRKVNIILGRFQPFTKGHLKMIEQGYIENGLPAVVLQISNKKFDDKHPFSDELTKEEINSIRNSLKTNIIGHFYVINADIAKIASVCHDNGFEPVLWITGTDRFEAYSKQANSEKYKIDNNLLDEFKCFEVKRTDGDISATKVREAIENDDFKTYVDMMPECVTNINMYNKFKTELKNLK